MDDSRQTTKSTDRAWSVLAEAFSTVETVGVVPGSVLPATSPVGPGLWLVEGAIVRPEDTRQAGREGMRDRRKRNPFVELTPEPAQLTLQIEVLPGLVIDLPQQLQDHLLEGDHIRGKRGRRGLGGDAGSLRNGSR